MLIMTDEVEYKKKRDKIRGGVPKTEYSLHCNRFNLFCQNRLRYFASLLECCTLPPSLTYFLSPSTPFSLLLQCGTLHFIVSPGGPGSMVLLHCA